MENATTMGIRERTVLRRKLNLFMCATLDHLVSPDFLGVTQR
jgi:hypothetical protein